MKHLPSKLVLKVESSWDKISQLGSGLACNTMRLRSGSPRAKTDLVGVNDHQQHHHNGHDTTDNHETTNVIIVI